MNTVDALSSLSTYEDGHQRFLQLVGEVENKINLNEAQIRLEIINTILYDCLGWLKHQDIKVEVSTERGFADYIISTTRNVAVLEAKRQSIGFNIPSSPKPITTSIPSLAKGNNDLMAAIKQAQGYAQSKGIALAIVSNGLQFVAFVASRSDGQSPMKGRAIAYSGL